VLLLRTQQQMTLAKMGRMKKDKQLFSLCFIILPVLIFALAQLIYMLRVKVRIFLH
jgi:hypothetical protein